MGENGGTRQVDLGRPACEQPARHSTSQAWAETVDAILRVGGFDGFLTNFEASEHAFDPRYELVAEIAREHHGKRAMAPADWVPVLEPILEDRFRDRSGTARSARSKATIVGALFTDYLDARFEVDGGQVCIRRTWPEGQRRSPAYGFERVAS